MFLFDKNQRTFNHASMGIAKGAYQLLLQEKKKMRLQGDSILQLGRQDIYLTYAQLQSIAQEHGLSLNPVDEVKLSHVPQYRKKGFIDDTTFFKSLGFQTVESLDFSSYEEATYVEDLNKPLLEKYREKYDVIFDGGTTEHIFDFPQVLRNIHLLLNEKGVVIHFSPSNNHVDHGFYMFSPTLFSEYYSANRYAIQTSNIFLYTPRHDKDPWLIYAYEPGVLDEISFGGFSKGLLGIFFVAQKTPEATCEAIPQQGMFHASWGWKDKKVPERVKSRKTLKQKLYKLLPKKVRHRLNEKEFELSKHYEKLEKYLIAKY